MTATAVPEFVVVALSARALVASACRDGRSVAALDLFADAVDIKEARRLAGRRARELYLQHTLAEAA